MVPVTDSHRRELAKLMLEAYRGTVDYEDETLEDAIQEIEQVFEGKYGALLRKCSFVAKSDACPYLVSATIVTLFEQVPLLAFSMTHPNHKRQGFGRALLQRSTNALLHEGYMELRLAVTDTNTPALNLYRSMGFREESEEVNP
jgi:GNAT superfamily N-acetyltransferase